MLAAICGSVVALRRRCPYLLVGWLWYLGMLVPVIGLVQVGLQAMADRYTYLPQIGLCIALAWGASDVTRSWPHRAWVCGVASALAVAVLMGCAWRQTSFWRDSETLWTHTLACTSGNYIAHYNLGVALADQGRLDEAIGALPRGPGDQARLRRGPQQPGRDPGQPGTSRRGDGALPGGLGNRARLRRGPQQPRHGLAGRGQFDEAIAHYRKALEIKPDFAEAHNNLGSALASRGQVDEAMVHYRQALKIKPDYAEAHNNLGVALASGGQSRRGHRPLPRRPWKSSPTTPRPTTTWARYWASREGFRRQSFIFAGPWRLIRNMPGVGGIWTSPRASREKKR